MGSCHSGSDEDIAGSRQTSATHVNNKNTEQKKGIEIPSETQKTDGRPGDSNSLRKLNPTCDSQSSKADDIRHSPQHVRQTSSPRRGSDEANDISEDDSSPIMLSQNYAKKRRKSLLWTSKNPEEMRLGDDPPDAILDFLDLGSYDNAFEVPDTPLHTTKRKELQDRAIGYILVVARECKAKVFSEIEYLKLDLTNDEAGAIKMLESLPRAFLFLDKVRLEGNQRVLVHGQEGTSRAPALVIAYLMARGKASFTKAFR